MMNVQSENHNIGEQPVRSPCVSDEILYELGYSISPSQEEKDESDHLTRKAVDQSEIKKDFVDQSEFTENFVKNRNTSKLDVKQVEESGNSTKEIACVLDKEKKQTDVHIGSEVFITSYPGHKLKDKKYLRKIKKRRRRGKGTTCSPTKIEAICREMSGLVVSEDDASATETSPESVQSEERTLHRNDSNEINLQDHNHESITSKQIHNETSEKENEDTNGDHSSMIELKSKTENCNSSGETTAVSSTDDENLSKEEDNEVEGELSPNEGIPSNPTSNTQKCTKSGSEDEVANSSEMKETGSTDIHGSLINENMEIESTEKESGANSVKKQVILLSSSSSDGNNYIDSNENSSQSGKGKMLTTQKITSDCEEYSYEELFGNIKKCSIKIRRLSEESIALYTGSSPNKQTNRNLPSEVSHVPAIPTLNNQPPLLRGEECSETSPTETSKAETIATDESPDNSKENGYTGSVMGPEKVQVENGKFKTTHRPSKLKSSNRRRSRRRLSDEICPSPEPKAKHKTSPSKSDILKTQEATYKPSFSETRVCENLRSLRGGKIVNQKVATNPRNRRERPGLFRSLSEVNFEHKKSTKLMNLEERNPNTKQSQNSPFTEKFSALTCKKFLEQIKKCSVNLKKIKCDSPLTGIAEKARSTVDLQKVDLETFKVPLTPEIYLRQQRMHIKTPKIDSGLSFEASTKVVNKPPTKLPSQQKAVSETNFHHNLSREQSWHQKFMASLNKSRISESGVEKELCNSETCSSVNMKACSVRLRKLSGDSIASFNQGVVSSNSKNLGAITKELRSDDASQLGHASESSSPIKPCSVSIQRLSRDAITTHLKRSMLTIFDKDLARTEKSASVGKESSSVSGTLGFIVPSLPVRKRRGSGDTMSSLSKWSTKRQPLKATKPNRGKAPKRKWIDSDSVESESSVRPCSVKLFRLDPDSVSNCAHIQKNGGDSMPHQIRNPALNVTNVDKVVDDELYCLRRFLQVPLVPEPGSSGISENANKSIGKHDVHKMMKPCSVVLKRITKNQNLQSVNIKKVIAKQLAENVEFSSESESSHEDEESSMDINKLLFSLSTGGEEKNKGHENEPAQDDIFLSTEVIGKVCEGAAYTKDVDNHNSMEDEITEGSSLPDRGNGKKDLATAEVMGSTADDSEGNPSDPVVIQTAVKILTDEKTAEEMLLPGDRRGAPQTSDAICKEVNINPMNISEVSKKRTENLTETVPLPVRRPESDIWSDDLPDIDVDLSVASVCSTSNSSLKGDAGKNGETCADLQRDYFQLAKLTKSCSVRLQKIDVI
ncbi:uncharacterized protein LOC125667612 [Ostrea edulis]|uniref:uncharacterized protein LOC125667612 n=1 Tax=Ostrea edulis TaxID=37623 RepID=UPI0024AEBD17|nr:uncharacterized protein LOC125667612 [Ostrea edulis]XP_048757166.2 uncharacterized protein LOC125667612 [Ostrea edulis]